MSNIILLSLISLGLVTSMSFFLTLKGEISVNEKVEIVGSERNITKEVTVDEFHSIMAFDQFNVVLRQGPSEIEISAPENHMEFVVVKNENGTLRIYREDENHRFVDREPIVVNISNPEFKTIEGHGQSSIFVEDGLSQDNLSIDLQDQSSFNGKLTVKSLETIIRNQARVNVRGTADKLDLVMRDQTDLRAGSFEVIMADVELGNQTNARINVTENLKGSLDDHSRLSYKGNPEKEQISKSQHAEVNKGWD